MDRPPVPAEPCSPDAGAPGESLYDLYLDQALRGEVAEPRAFLRAHGSEGDGELLARLVALQRAAGRGRPPEPRADGLPCERLGPYRLLRRLGSGGMGQVFLAEDESLGRRVALKLLRPDLSDAPAARERFEREARAVARLHHPHIVTLHGVGQEGDLRWLVLEYLEGRGLDEALAEAPGGLAVADVLRWGAQLAGALQAAHEQGLVHRDVKPGNVQLAPDGRALLLDFGVARDIGSQASTLGAFAGSLPWAAPEQVDARHGPIDARTDVWGLGATLYEAATGRRPFPGGTAEQQLRAVLDDDPRPPRELQPALPRDLQTVLLKALEKEPARRYPTAAALQADLRAILEFRPITASPPGPGGRVRRAARRHPERAAAAATAALALLLLAGWRVRERLAASGEARALVLAARAAVQQLAERQAQVEGLELLVAKLQRAQGAWTLPEEDAELDRHGGQVAATRRQRLLALTDIQRQLDLAQRLDPQVEGADSVRAELFLALWRDAGRRGDPREQEDWARLVRAADPGGGVAAQLVQYGTLDLSVDPPDARVDLYRYDDLSQLRPEGEPRLVPVPWGGLEPHVPPGSFALRVLADHGPLRAGDHVVELCGFPLRDLLLLPDEGLRLLSVDGRRTVEPYDLARCRDDRAGRSTTVHNRSDPYAPATPPSGPVRCAVQRPDGSTATLELPDLAALEVRVLDPLAAARRGGLPARVARPEGLVPVTLPPDTPAVPTAAPLLPTAASRLPPGLHRLPAGAWLACASVPGREPLRLGFQLHGGNLRRLAARLRPAGAGPPGCVLVDTEASDAGAPRPAFWIMAREVNQAEWADFLDATWSDLGHRRAERPGRGPHLELVPRRGPHVEDALWERDAASHWRWPADSPPDAPVTGISLHDAQAYAAWLDARERAAGRPFAWSVPTHEQWRAAAGGGTERTLAYGREYRSKWSNTCFSRPLFGPRPSFSHPIDESPLGVFDLTGNAAEWTVTSFSAQDGEVRVLGGSWGDAAPEIFTLDGGGSLRPEFTSATVGLRLVATPLP